MLALVYKQIYLFKTENTAVHLTHLIAAACLKFVLGLCIISSTIEYIPGEDNAKCSDICEFIGE